jgi:hypothetical protein
MAYTPEMRQGDKNGGLRRYTTSEYGELVFDVFTHGARCVIDRRNRMINLEAMHSRGFRYENEYNGRPVYVKTVQVGNWRQDFVVDSDMLHCSDLWRELDRKIDFIRQELIEKSMKNNTPICKNCGGMKIVPTIGCLNIETCFVCDGSGYKKLESI